MERRTEMRDPAFSAAPPTAQPIRILLIEDTPEDAHLLRTLLAQEPEHRFELQHADRLAKGLKRLAQGGIDVVLLDLNLPDSRGLETAAKVLQQAPQAPIVVLTASDDVASAVQALHTGVQDYLVKAYVQVYPRLLWQTIRYAIERKRSEEEVRNAHERTEKLLASIPSILIGVNNQGLVVHWNALAEHAFNLTAPQVLRRPVAECGIPWDLPRILEGLAACRKTGTLARLDDVAFSYPDGREGFLGFAIRPIPADRDEQGGFLLFGADITERKLAERERARLQEQLVQAQKMDTIGRFAGGIAHDFNNFLQIILGFAKILRQQHGDHPELAGDLDQILGAGTSASELVQQLLAFSRRQPTQPQRLELNQALQGVVTLLQHFIGERIRVSLELAPQPLPVTLDPTALQQIIMNLASNARDAMPDGGQLTLRTTLARLDGEAATRHPSAQKGSYACLEIQDTGTGMDPAVASRIFEPFFTTKQAGSGTGLGLAVVYGLVRQIEGFIDLETAPGEGTTFKLYFPLQAASSECEVAFGAPTLLRSSPGSALSGPSQPFLPGGQAGRHRILIVDDEPAIRLLCERILRASYEVSTAPSASTALELLARQPFALLLTDLKMPEGDGFALLEEAARRQPELKLLAMTGSLAIELEQWLRSSTMFRCGVIHKPFSPLLLEEAVRHSLLGAAFG